uniref:Insulin gene enhancer protein ISL-1 n=1 Tax=Platynereis dumerilii TaxID=6359 RepID=A6YB99_PLADU|nr:Islet [Platynereis dumerilii]
MATEPQAKGQILYTERKHSSMCVGCGSKIQDQYILRVAPDLEWHAACLKCADCDQFLDETCTCFVREGKTYCKRDYARLFGTKCARCTESFSKNDFVMRARNKIYHIDCFRCVACSRQLIPGDEFALRDDGLFCKSDHEVLERAQNGATPTPENNNNNVNALNNNEKEIKTEKTGSIKSGQAEHGSRRGNSGHKSEHKPTRVRTVLNEKQLHTLRTCYNANPRPDALMKEQLTEMTGLSPRVIGVWFQNKRCKDKKRSIALKQMQEQQHKNGTLGRPLSGVPMVASSPVRHESNLQPNPVEVTSYQPPWKALSEFATQSELDQPPFHQLEHAMFLRGEEDKLMYHGYRSDLDSHHHTMNSFDSPESMNGGYTGMSDNQTPPGSMYLDDYSQPPNSVSSSELPPTPSELSSPMSQ